MSPADGGTLTVTQLNEYVRMLLDGAPLLSGLFVRGEISNFKNHYATGHFYFTLKDETGNLRAVMFRSAAQKLGFVPENGMKVIAHGRVSVFPRDGVYQLYADDIQPDGVGALYYAFEQLKRKLEGEGLFDPARKKPLDPMPRRIGIVTSPTGAAVRDMINILGRRFPSAEVYIYPAQVQGPSAPAQLCAGIRFFNERLAVDTVIIGRGGGSLEDLWAFNNETLARYIAASRVPVISAVGHETDFTVCDFAADLRAPTPSAAAELAVPDRSGLANTVGTLSLRLDAAASRAVTGRRDALGRLAMSRMLSDPARLTDDKKMALVTLAERLGNASRRASQDAKASLTALASQLGALDPFAVLTRGYAAVFREGTALRSVAGLAPGDRVTIRLADGETDADITNIKKTGNYNGKIEL